MLLEIRIKVTFGMEIGSLEETSEVLVPFYHLTWVVVT